MNFHKNHWLLFSVVFFGYVALAWIVGIGPAIWTQANSDPLPGSAPLTALEQHGLEVYIAEGCVACHTQQVRPLKMDEVWGRPSTAGDYAHVRPLGILQPYAPAVLGSERTGPDLTSIGARQPSATWQYIHLFQPRAVVPDSIMPAFPWLFEVADQPGADALVVPVPAEHAPASGKVVATERARALVAYLASLKQVALKGEPSSSAASKAPASTAPASAPAGQAQAQGVALYASHCASCHQASGEGLPGVFPPLKNDPVVNADDPTEHVETVLNGAHGRTIDGKTYPSEMPGFGDQLSDEQIAAIVTHERSSWGNHGRAVTAQDVTDVRARGGSK